MTNVKNLNTNKSQQLAEAANVSEADLAGKGHNRKIQKNPALIALFEQIEKFNSEIKTISYNIRQVRTRIKDEHGIAKMVISEELRRRKLDPAVRSELENGLATIQHQLGYQFALPLHDTTPTDGKTPNPVEAAAKEAKA